MSQKEFVVSKDGKQAGPFSIDTIVSMVQTQQLGVMDYIYDEEAADWLTIIEHKAIQKTIKEFKPKVAPQKNPGNFVSMAAALKKKENSANRGVAEWYILKGENKFGPFAFHDVIKMLQQKLVFEFDFAWKQGMKSWVRIAELDSFDPTYIQQLQETLMPEISEVFFRRRHRRVYHNGTLIVHDNKSVWKGQAIEISAGGAGVVMENAMLVPGQKIYIHFKPCDELPPFNAIAEVVSKRFVEGVTDRKAPIRYGLKFTSISEDTQETIINYSNTRESA